MKNCVTGRWLPEAFHLVLLVLAFVIVALNAYAAPSRPNVLLIVADDLGIQLPAYGDHTIDTPNLDSLAADGVVFRNGYTAQSSCSPSRSSIHSGTYPHQNGHIGLQGFFKMRQAYPTISSILHNAGYRTGVIGKTHVSPPTAFKWDFAALQNGWDDGIRRGTSAASRLLPSHSSPRLAERRSFSRSVTSIRTPRLWLRITAFRDN